MENNKKKKSNKKNIAIIVTCAILALILVVVLCAYLIIKGYISKVNIVQPGEYVTYDGTTEPPETITGESIDQDSADKIEDQLSDFVNGVEVMSSEDVTNILLIGIDNRHFEDVTIMPGNSDAMILVSINSKTKEIYLTSFMRDLYVYVDFPDELNALLDANGNQRYVDAPYKINRANAVGGPELLLDVIESNFKIEVDKYICVNFYSLIDIIDILGGIPMTLTDAEAEYANYYIRDMDFDRGIEDWETANVLSSGGTYTLNGVQAVGYARERQTTGSDYTRTDRQRAVLEQVFIKAKSMSLSQLNSMANTILPKVTTNISENEILSLVANSITYLTYDLKQMRVPFDGMYTSENINGEGMLVPDLKATYDVLIEAIYGVQ